MASLQSRCLIPFFSSSIRAGFPSPSDDHIDQHLDLNELVIKQAASTFFVRVEGRSMEGAGIHSGDILVVDRSLTASNGKIVVAVLHGEFTVKRLYLEEKKAFLCAESPHYPSIEISSDECQIWGVVTYVIHKAE